MQISQRGIDLIKSFEGYEVELKDGRCRAYWDADGKVWTIGWGCTEGVKKGDVWTREEAEQRFAEEMRKHFKFVEEQAPWANQNEFDALASFSYNGGPGMLRQLLRRYPDKQKLADAFMLFDHSGGKRLRGLTRRRAAEKALFLEPVPERTSAVALIASRRKEKLTRIKADHPRLHFWDKFLDYCGIGGMGLWAFLEKVGAVVTDWRTAGIAIGGLSLWVVFKLAKFYFTTTLRIGAADPPKEAVQ